MRRAGMAQRKRHASGAWAAGTTVLKVGAAASLAAALTLATLMATGGTPAQAQDVGGEPFDDSAVEETVEFLDLPTPVLLEIYDDIARVLVERGVLDDADRAASAYARHLVARALDLSLGGSEAGPPVASGPDGVRYAILASVSSSGGAARFDGLDALGGLGVDRVAVVVFQRDFQVREAALAAPDAFAPFVGTDGGAALTRAFWRADGVETITGRLFRAAQAE